MRCIVFTLDETRYAVAMDNVVEVDRLPAITSIPNVPAWIEGLANLRGEIISVVDLRQYLNMDTQEFVQSRQMLIVRSHNTDLTTSLIVDRVIGIRTFPKTSIKGMLGQIGMGMFDARCDVVSQDELGQVALSLNSMCDNTMSLIQSQDQREALEGAIDTLKAQVASIADGDLTSEVAVDERAGEGLTELASSVNYMVSQLREIVSNVQGATVTVSGSANEIQSTTEHLSTGSEAQAAQILDTTAAIDEMAVSIQQVSENTVSSAEVAQTARDNAVKGAEAVPNTIKGMDRIRNQVQDTSKRIKRLGESSQQIGEIVQLIGDIADRTSILALNASIQAAMAGEAGQGFAVVAEEVERLAERATDYMIKPYQDEQLLSLAQALMQEAAETATV